MSYLFDTDVCIELLRNRDPSLHERFRKVPVLETLTSAVVEAELFVGVHRSRNPKEEGKRVGHLLGRFTILPVDGEVARGYAEIRAFQEAKGVRIGNNDLFIAATALLHGLTLVTRNFREYSRIPGLKLDPFV